MVRFWIGAAAVAVLGYCVGLVVFGGRFPAPGEAAVSQDVILFTTATVLASLLYLGGAVAAHRQAPSLKLVLLVGAAARLVLLFGAPPPVLEGDPARLRFDGRLVNQGVHPYEFKPQHLMDADPQDVHLDDRQHDRLVRARAAITASTDAPRPDEVRRPDQRTSATPLALWIGSLADAFKPGSTRGYAFFILCADALACFFLLLALNAMRLPLGWLLVYAWSPVLLKELYTTMAIDAFVLPAIAALVYCLASKRHLLAGIPLAIAAALRPAHLLLTPVLARRVGAGAVVLALVLFLVPFLPFHGQGVEPGAYAEGQLHTWRHYEYNSLMENGLRGMLTFMPTRAENSLTVAGVSIVEPGEKLDVLLAKVACLVLLLGMATYLVIRVSPAHDVTGAARYPGLTDLFLLLATLLFVSPVLHPWHSLWLLPLLVVRPFGLAWLALPGLLSLSYVTHLVGANAADLTILDGRLSFRVVEFGLFALLLGVDLVFRKRIFDRAERYAEAAEESAERASADASQPSPAF